MSFRGYRSANTALQHLNQSLRRERDAVASLNHELESFSYSVSHDLRSPLRRISCYAQVLLEDFAESLGTEGMRVLERITDASVKMGHLIDALLDLARVSRAEIERTEVNLSGLAHRVATHLRAGAPDRECDIVIEDGLQAIGDARLLGVVLDNLLSNAWKFTAKRARAEIRFGHEDRDGITTYFVRDNGAGFDMADRAKLFSPFQRLHAEAEFEGTGVGLATVQRIVRRHDGIVWAEGVVDRGATFYFTLGRG
jgi:light-regulated signal transduction histidine kinase (bacteriophytochrome)